MTSQVGRREADRPTPPVGVVMSVHNGQPYLEEAIRSIRSQTLADFEFIVINDGSRDDSAAIIESHARHDPRSVVVHQENRGLIASLNRAVGMARAGVVARMDADDVALPSRLEVQLDAMRRERPALVSCAFEIVTADGRVRAVKDTYPDADLAPRFMLFYNFVAGHSQVMFDRDLAVEAGLYDVDDLHVEDYGLWVRLLRKGRFVALPQVLHRYRFHDASVSRTNMAAQTEGLVTLARGQLVDLGLELSREDVRPLQHFGLCATTAAYRIPRSGPPQRHRSAPEGGPCLLLSPAPERAGHLAEPPIASVSTSRLAMCGGVVVCHGARGS